MAKIFSDIGWHTNVVQGGYKAYRKTVLDGLDQLPRQFQLILLSGPTGTAKTHILRAAANKGAQVLDLEKLANHRVHFLAVNREFRSLPKSCLSRA